MLLLFTEPRRLPAAELPPEPFLYQLQEIDIAAAASSPFRTIVTDYSHDGSATTELTASEVAELKAGGTKTVLAYMSIGEAEDYRFYWDPAWTDEGGADPDRPAWLGLANPDWAGNYKVRYWDPAWQAIIFGSPASYADRILAAGFDGIYLDIIDAYEYWGPDGDLPSSERRETAEQDMVDFVLQLSAYCRIQPGHADFLVVPQNGAALGLHDDYLAAVSGIGAEDTWYNGDARQRSSHTRTVVPLLNRFRDAGKTVLVIDYPRKEKNIDAFYSRAEASGYAAFAATRELDALIVHPKHDPVATLSVALASPPDGDDASPSVVPTFSWTATAPGPLSFRVSFSGSDALHQIYTLPKTAPTVANTYTPSAAEWRAVMRLARQNTAGRIYWWVTAQDTARALRSTPRRELRLGHTGVVTTVFWIGAPPSPENNQLGKLDSAWDTQWAEHYGGTDDPVVRSTDPGHPFWPAFIPAENPFYVALPYNDFDSSGGRRWNFRDSVPWAGFTTYGELESAVKNHWVKISYNGQTCYAQWEDVGPFNSYDVRYVFGINRPKNKLNFRSGLEVSPAVRDYLGLTGLNVTDWRFVFPGDPIPAGPWLEVVTTSQITR